MNKFLVALIIVCPIFFSCSTPQKENTLQKEIPKNPHLQTFTKDYVKQFEAILTETNTPGAGLVVVKDEQILHLSGYGTKAAFSNDSVDVHTVFRVGSLSKGFASILAGILVEQGELKWTDKVQEYVPEFVLKDEAQAKRVNLIHLLSQSSGLPYHAYTNLVEAGLDVRKIASQLKSVKLISKEGEIYAYQNAAYSLIGTVLEEVTKNPYPKFLRKNFFNP